MRKNVQIGATSVLALTLVLLKSSLSLFFSLIFVLIIGIGKLSHLQK